MPWNVRKGYGRCGPNGYAVVKTDSDEIVACHPSRASAERQVRLLYAKEPGAGRGASEEESMSERRFTLLPVEARSREGRRSIGGYAAVFDKVSQPLGGFVERGTPAMFNKTRGDGWVDVICRYNHDDAYLLGTTSGGTLRLSVDKVGLDYEVDPPDSRRDIVELVERRDISKSSFAFRAIEDDWDMSEQGYPMRTLIEVQLVDVAPVTQPAYLDATAGLRSLANKFDASLEEVRSMAERDELRKFFVKTDKGLYAPHPPKRRLSGAVALARIQELEDA